MDIARYRTRLTELAAELDVQRASGAESADTVELDQARVGRLSRMDALQAQAMSVETRRRQALERQRVAAALARIDNDEYGCCLRCGEAIDERRLEVDPGAPLCLTCAERAE